MDLSALGAQAAAGVERAQKAAREQLVAALGTRPRLSLRMELDGPKVAVPVPATGAQGAPWQAQSNKQGTKKCLASSWITCQNQVTSTLQMDTILLCNLRCHH